MPEERIDRIERALELLVGQTQAFQGEMLSFKDEMRAFKEEMVVFKQEMLVFKERTEAFLLRLDASIQESKRDRKEFRKAWGDLANKMGTILEEIAAPSIRRLAREEFGFSVVDDLMVRTKRVNRYIPGRHREFDVICAGPGHVIYGEMKSTPDLESLNKMLIKLQELFDYYPEYRGCRLIGVYCSRSLDEKMRAAIARAGLYGVAMGEEAMEVVVRPS